jgi:hypothetical protein
LETIEANTLNRKKFTWKVQVIPFTDRKKFTWTFGNNSEQANTQQLPGKSR